MNLTIAVILVLLFSLNTLAEELPLELMGTASETDPVKTMSVPSETLMKLMEARQQDLDRREAVVRRDEERLKLLRIDIEGLFKKQEKPGKPGVASPTVAKPGSGAAAVPSANLVHLSQAFETMPVEEAAQRIDKMKEAVALDLLARLKGKTAGAILAALSPGKAARLVEKLAANPRTASSEPSLERK
jgi:flagellar motility protein MotE (MotC chaperone)